MNNGKITVIIPIYNEVSSLPELLSRIHTQFKSLGTEANCIISDDGSTDDTKLFLQSAKHIYAWLDFVQAPKNEGKSKALSRALHTTDSSYIIIMDGDLQNDPIDFLPLYKTIKDTNADCVAGWRKFRKDDFIKNTLSKIYNALINIIFDMDLHDHNCGMKIFQKEAVTGLLLKGEWHRYITVLMHHAGYKVIEQAVVHHPRQHGKSRYGINRYIRFFSDLLPLFLQINQQKILMNNRRFDA